MTEHHDHDDCHECGGDSRPMDGPDSIARFCPACGFEWTENLRERVYRAPEWVRRRTA
jgi:NAD-dependent dihydropyrimidine dehydrogenase PreA subunit